jgi:hypothetical protein
MAHIKAAVPAAFVGSALRYFLTFSSYIPRLSLRSALGSCFKLNCPLSFDGEYECAPPRFHCRQVKPLQPQHKREERAFHSIKLSRR